MSQYAQIHRFDYAMQIYVVISERTGQQHVPVCFTVLHTKGDLCRGQIFAGYSQGRE